MLPRVVPGIYPVLLTALLTEIKLQLFDSGHNWGGGLFYNYWVSFCGVDVQGGSGNNEISRVYGLLPDVIISEQIVSGGMARTASQWSAKLAV